MVDEDKITTAEMPVPLDWKTTAIKAAVAKAQEAETARLEKIARVKERARTTFSKYLTNCGVPFTDSDIQFEVTKSNEVRTFVVVDGIEFSTRKAEFEYQGCGIVHTCKECGQREVGYTVNSPAELGKELTNPNIPYHRCEPFPTSEIEPETTETRLVKALQDFVAENCYQG